MTISAGGYGQTGDMGALGVGLNLQETELTANAVV